MRLTLRILGLEVVDLDIATDITEAEEYEPDPHDLSGGTLASTPVGFYGQYEVPQDVEMPERYEY
jgi:hypothetical protein